MNGVHESWNEAPYSVNSLTEYWARTAGEEDVSKEKQDCGHVRISKSLSQQEFQYLNSTAVIAKFKL